MNIKKDDKSELEIEIDKKIVQSRNEVKTKKQLLEEAENKKKQLEKDAKENNKKIRRLKFEAEKANANAKKDADIRLKIHAGGMVEMTGLMRYVYPEGCESDNPQDSLIANLLVGAFQVVADSLENMSVEKLESLWVRGQNFRKASKKERTLPKVNPNLDELINSVKIRIKASSATNQQPNDNVQGVKANVQENNSEKDN